MLYFGIYLVDKMLDCRTKPHNVLKTAIAYAYPLHPPDWATTYQSELLVYEHPRVPNVSLRRSIVPLCTERDSAAVPIGYLNPSISRPVLVSLNSSEDAHVSCYAYVRTRLFQRTSYK